jgi:DNA-binding LytR/AlgR family response regulator
MNKLRVFIVDDELFICEALQRQLEKFSYIEVSGTFHDGEEALSMVEKYKPDIIFLDIRMPGRTGIEIAAVLDQREFSPAVVFVTAYDEFALKSYEVNAIDYILKPFEKSDIERVLRKMRKQYFRQDMELSTENIIPKEKVKMILQKFCCYKEEEMVIIDSQNIQLFCVADGEVFLVTTSGEKHLLKQTLQEIEKKIDEQQFFRCHRNYIVNMNFVKQILPWFNRGYLLKLQGEQEVEVPVSRSHAKKLENYIYF